MTYDRTLTSALAFSKEGRLEEWIHLYLTSHGNNLPFSQGLKTLPRHYLGPVRMPITLFRRNCGPEEHMKWQVDPVHFEEKVQRLTAAIEKDPDMPPLIISYRFNDKTGLAEFELNDGNGRFEAYTRLGHTHVQVIFWITEEAEYEDFLARYGHHFAPQSL